jgi:hypothetical protein
MDAASRRLKQGADLLVVTTPSRAGNLLIALVLIGAGLLLLWARKWRQRHSLFARDLPPTSLYVLAVYVAGPIFLIVLGLAFLAGAILGT